MNEKDLFRHVNVGLGLFQNNRLATLRKNSTAWIGLQLRRTAQNNSPTFPARSCVFGRVWMRQWKGYGRTAERARLAARPFKGVHGKAALHIYTNTLPDY